MPFPEQRLRRLRRTPTIRRLVRETRLTPDDFVYPLFVVPGRGVEEPVSSMPGVVRYSVDRVAAQAREVEGLDIPAVILFGVPETKDERGSSSLEDEGVVQRAIGAIREAAPELMVIADVCLCEYTDHGHCGALTEAPTLPGGKEVDNDTTLEILGRQALSFARAGAQMVAPSGMMDGQVAAIRDALDEGGFEWLPIMSYSAKYASAFYGPFREAAESTPGFGDRRGYQMDPANLREALREVALDVEEGADIVMVKPALAYLDVIQAVRDEFDLPVAAYNVSGEYSLVRAAAERGWIDGEQVMMEVLTAIKRAGADLVITYFALDAARLASVG